LPLAIPKSAGWRQKAAQAAQGAALRLRHVMTIFAQPRGPRALLTPSLRRYGGKRGRPGAELPGVANLGARPAAWVRAVVDALRAEGVELGGIVEDEGGDPPLGAVVQAHVDAAVAGGCHATTLFLTGPLGQPAARGETGMIGYVTIGVRDLERSRAFYDAILVPLGGKRSFSGQRMQGYAAARGATLAICTPYDGQPASVGNGAMVALSAPSPAVIAEVYELAMANGAVDDGPPGQRSETFHGAYFRDPDGNKICVYKGY
jgi:catechol 2,3-dioxygenase-like lactoylglutathione lyase family enzyme